jgi:hypothetical protein
MLIEVENKEEIQGLIRVHALIEFDEDYDCTWKEYIIDCIEKLEESESSIYLFLATIVLLTDGYLDEDIHQSLIEFYKSELKSINGFESLDEIFDESN